METFENKYKEDANIMESQKYRQRDFNTTQNETFLHDLPDETPLLKDNDKNLYENNEQDDGDYDVNTSLPSGPVKEETLENSQGSLSFYIYLLSCYKVQLLERHLSRGLDTNVADTFGKTALMYAQMRNDQKAIKMLKWLGAHVERESQEDFVIDQNFMCRQIYLAAQNIMEPLFVENVCQALRCSVDIRNRARETALSVAVKDCNTNAILSLLESGAQVDELIMTEATNNKWILETLIKHTQKYRLHQSKDLIRNILLQNTEDPNSVNPQSTVADFRPSNTNLATASNLRPTKSCSAIHMNTNQDIHTDLEEMEDSKPENTNHKQQDNNSISKNRKTSVTIYQNKTQLDLTEARRNKNAPQKSLFEIRNTENVSHEGTIETEHVDKMSQDRGYEDTSPEKESFKEQDNSVEDAKSVIVTKFVSKGKGKALSKRETLYRK
ncbi:hypothetical protein BgiBS90_031235 [Biomphalaria glabrata]|nr:hypothetical protein BgiBS90_031235 [Biomphalaria glabrata]